MKCIFTYLLVWTNKIFNTGYLTIQDNFIHVPFILNVLYSVLWSGQFWHYRWPIVLWRKSVVTVHYEHYIEMLHAFLLPALCRHHINLRWIDFQQDCDCPVIKDITVTFQNIFCAPHFFMAETRGWLVCLAFHHVSFSIGLP